MYKNIPPGIKKYELNPSLHKLHKEGLQKSDFGMDNTSELLDGGFGLYSSTDVKKRIGPIKSEYYRIALIRSGTVDITIGLENFKPVRNNIIFGFPGQVFSFNNPSKDFFCYYMLFKEEFFAEALLSKQNRNRFPFFTYAGLQYIKMSEEEGVETENLFFKVNEEIKNGKSDISNAVRLYIQLILINAGRCYGNTMLASQSGSESGTVLFNRFLKLVSQHFLTSHKVSEYAELLHVSPDHLNRTIKSHSNKTAHELIDEMIFTEAKALLLHTQLSVAEIAFQLEFSDPSHFNKFFKKLSGCTPLQFRSKPA